MQIKEITDKTIWEGFLLGCSEKTFLHSWKWGEFEQKRNHHIWRFGFFDASELVGVAFAVKISARRGTFLLVPHGPVLADAALRSLDKKQEALQLLLRKLSEIGEQEKAAFLRISPLWERTEENKKLFQNQGFREASMHADYTYEASWKLNLTIPEAELLKNMRKTTRYLIGQTSRNEDISVEISDNEKDIERYDELNQEIATRQQFVPFSKEYIKNEFEVFAKDRETIWIFGTYKGKLAAGALIIFWSGIAFYHQAASRREFAKLSLPYLLQWEAIKEAKKRGCTVYDLWGYVNPKEFPSHPWAGPTLFKMGFGGEAYLYVKTQDFPINWKYWITNTFERIRKMKRGL